jgi:hypothetical protein
MDCHNRPTHIFRSPDAAANVALYVNSGLQTLPFAKREVVAALVKTYPSKEHGLGAVPAAIQQFYELNHPDLWRDRRDDVERLATLARDIYQSNFFPEMNVTWRTYPDNIGHKIFPGCFRCHDGKHVDDKGITIRSECGTCHEFMVPLPGEKPDPSVVQTGGFIHPIPLPGVHATLRCDACHTGGPAPKATCGGCHVEVAEFRAGRSGALSGFGLQPDSMAEAVDCDGCHDLSKPADVTSINERCMDCHSDDEERFDGMLAGWKAEIEELLRQAGQLLDPSARETVAALHKAGPLHNTEASRAVLRGLLSRGSVSKSAGADAAASVPEHRHGPGPPGGAGTER